MKFTYQFGECHGLAAVYYRKTHDRGIGLCFGPFSFIIEWEVAA